MPFLHWPLSKVTLIQNNQYAIVGYFGAACPGPQHGQKNKTFCAHNVIK